MISITSTERRTRGMLRLARPAMAILVAVVSVLAAPGVRAATESEAAARAVIADVWAVTCSTGVHGWNGAAVKEEGASRQTRRL